MDSLELTDAGFVAAMKDGVEETVLENPRAFG